MWFCDPLPKFLPTEVTSMKACPICGRDVSIWGRDLTSGVCKECTEAQELAEGHRQRVRELREHAQLDEHEKEVRVWIRKTKSRMLKRLNEGQPVFLYHSVYIPVDSVLMDEPVTPRFELYPLFKMGLAGWEAIQVV